MLKWFTNSFFNTKTASSAFVVGIARNAILSQPLSQRFGLTIKRYLAPFATLTLIIVLLLPGSPSTVLGAVRPVVVDAVEAVELVRPPSHISQEVLVGLPVIAYGDTSASVVNVLLVVDVLTPSLHLRPSPIFGSLFTVGSFPMLPTTFAASYTKIAAQTTTGFRPAATQHRPGDGLFGAAITPTYEAELAMFAFIGNLQNGPAPKLLSNMIYRFHNKPPSVHSIAGTATKGKGNQG